MTYRKTGFLKFFILDFKRGLRWQLCNRGNICSADQPKVFEIDMAQGQDMPKGPGTEGILLLSALVPEIQGKNQK